MQKVTHSFDRKLFEETICKLEFSIIDDLMKAAFGDYRGGIGQLLYVGEACRMPIIKEMMKQYLSENCLIASDRHNLDQSEVVAKGTALIAAQSSGSKQFGMFKHKFE